MDIAAWLRGLGLEQYEPAFLANEIDEKVLPHLTSEDLREIGVVPIGHRRRLLDAIAVLGASAPTTAVTAAVSGASAPPDAERRQLTVCFAIWSARRRCRRASIPRICARSWAPMIAASPMRWAALPDLLRNAWATVCSFISAIPRRTKMMPSDNIERSRFLWRAAGTGYPSDRARDNDRPCSGPWDAVDGCRPAPRQPAGLAMAGWEGGGTRRCAMASPRRSTAWFMPR